MKGVGVATHNGKRECRGWPEYRVANRRRLDPTHDVALSER
jgi:hypothetical protein